MTRAPTGPRPQRHEIVEALDALATAGIAAVGQHIPGAELVGPAIGGELRRLGLELLERLGVDTASVRVTADQAPRLIVRTPPHDTEV